MISWKWTGELEGTQEGVATNPPFAPARRTVPTAFGENYGGEQLDLIIGVNFLVPDGRFSGNRFAADLRVPLYQEVNGIRLEETWVLTLGYQYAF